MPGAVQAGLGRDPTLLQGRGRSLARSNPGRPKADSEPRLPGRRLERGPAGLAWEGRPIDLVLIALVTG